MKDVKKEIVRKLTSRKFWMSLAAFVSMLMIYCGADAQTAEKTTALIMAGASVIGYILAEGLTDANRTYDEEDDEENSDE